MKYTDLDVCKWCDQELGESAKRGRDGRLYCFGSDCAERQEAQDRSMKAHLNGFTPRSFDVT